MTDHAATPLLELAHRIADDFSALPLVTAVAASGSLTGGSADAGSDIDLYVYQETEIPVNARAAMVGARASRAALDNRFWEPGDEWIEGQSGVAVDVTYRSPQWIEQQLDRVLVRHEASTGYSTCFWYNVANSVVLFDRTGWFGQLQQRARQPYPEALRRAIIAKNHPILRDLLASSYLHQLEKAVERRDLVSVNHRIAALLASYFDVLFALNRVLHPGEKRLLKLAEERCEQRPATMRCDVENLLAAAGPADRSVLAMADRLIEGLDTILSAEGLIEPTRSS